MEPRRNRVTSRLLVGRGCGVDAVQRSKRWCSAGLQILWSPIKNESLPLEVLDL